MQAAPDTATPDPHNVQGNIAGFNKDHQRFVFLRFADKPSAQAFLGAVVDDIATCDEVNRFNRLFKLCKQRRHGEERRTVQSTWLNLALTNSGLQLLEPEGLAGLPEDFTQGMKARAVHLGDIGANEPGNWVSPFTEEMHALVILAADDADDLNKEYEHLKEHLEQHQVQQLAAPIDGKTRSGDETGHEHFGFRDGISQPAIAGLAETSKGQEPIAAGEFICGYPGGIEPPPPPQPPPAGYNPEPPPPLPPGMPAWTKDGSFLVFRRLRQNVKGFVDFIAEETADGQLSDGLLSAKLVGRYKSGAPLERTPDEAPGLNPEVADPSVADPSLLTDAKINNFDYDEDADGLLVPRAAHIRKANPRSGDPRGKADANTHRILRRGIPYGSEFTPEEPPYPNNGPVPPEQDRGLLFLCYQSSIAAGFEFIQTQWANQQNFPQDGDGEDPIISQEKEPRTFTLPRQNEPLHLALKQWVRTTGGEYFFSPSISALKQLAGEV